MSKTTTLTYKLANSVIIKNAIILNIIHNIFKLKVVIFKGYITIETKEAVHIGNSGFLFQCE